MGDTELRRGAGPTQSSRTSHTWTSMDRFKEHIRISAKRFQTRSNKKWRTFITSATELSRRIRKRFASKEPTRWADHRQMIPAHLVSGAVMYMKRRDADTPMTVGKNKSILTTERSISGDNITDIVRSGLTTDFSRECLSAHKSRDVQQMMPQGQQNTDTNKASTIQVQPAVITSTANEITKKEVRLHPDTINKQSSKLSALPASGRLTTVLDTERACLATQKRRSDTITGDERGVTRDATSPNPRGQREQLEDNISAELTTHQTEAIGEEASNQQPWQHTKGSKRRGPVADRSDCLARQSIGVT